MTCLETILAMETTQGNFTDQIVEDQLIKTIIEAATRAPNASNRQSYSIISISNQDTIQEAFGFKAPHALLFCVDYNRVLDTAHFLGEPYQTNGALSFIHGAVDTILAAENAALAARSLGLGEMFTNSLHRQPLDKLYATFNLPEQYCFPLIVLLLGYSTGERSYRKGRLTDLGILHQETYQRLIPNELATLVDFINDPLNHMAPTGDPKLAEGETFLHWYFNNWPNKPNSEKQKELIDRLKQSGFLL